MNGMTAEEARERLAELRDEFVRRSSHGRYHDAASREWQSLPQTWRMALVMLAGVGLETDSVELLAGRAWREFPEPERAALRCAIRAGKQAMASVSALAARV